MAKQVKFEKVIVKKFVEANGQLIEVVNTSSVEQYPKDVTIYVKQLAKGTKAGELEFWVPVVDYIPTKRASAKEVASAMLIDVMTNKLTAEQVEAKYGIKLQ